MVGQMTASKPSRSDEVLDADQQQKIADQIRSQFDSMAPKRPTKPNRSESDITPTAPLDVSGNIPELEKFQALRSRSHIMFSNEGKDEVQDEFVETQYYRELGYIDKQHHTTGSGFIRAVREGGENGYNIQLRGGHDGAGGRMVFTGFRSNPATNDWVPSVEEEQVFVSSKPNRSESC